VVCQTSSCAGPWGSGLGQEICRRLVKTLAAVWSRSRKGMRRSLDRQAARLQLVLKRPPVNRFEEARSQELVDVDGRTDDPMSRRLTGSISRFPVRDFSSWSLCPLWFSVYEHQSQFSALISLCRRRSAPDARARA
jgi:hypothetical protein